MDARDKLLHHQDQLTLQHICELSLYVNIKLECDNTLLLNGCRQLARLNQRSQPLLSRIIEAAKEPGRLACRCWLHQNIRGPGPCFGQCSTSREDRRVRHGIATLHGRGERHAPPSRPLGPALIADRRRWDMCCTVCCVCILYSLSFERGLVRCQPSCESRPQVRFKKEPY